MNRSHQGASGVMRDELCVIYVCDCLQLFAHILHLVLPGVVSPLFPGAGQGVGRKVPLWAA